MSQEERQDAMNAIKNVAELNKGDEINDTPNISNESCEGYIKMGKVYKYPETGKLILLEE